MFFAWYFISNAILKKDMYFVKKKDVVVEQTKEKKEPKQEEILLPERKPKVVNKRHKTKRLKRRTKQLRKSNWAREQLERHSIGEKSVFTSQN
jgi:hypothetical protein|tara:strand:+ start:286 stop:564 length:279 start_codon:yes stop_codon:yes gene_type:complete